MTPASLGPKKMLRDKCNLAVGLADKNSSDLAQRHFTLTVFVIHSVLKVNAVFVERCRGHLYHHGLAMEPLRFVLRH